MRETQTRPPLRIVDLQIENVQKIRAIRIHPDGSPVVVLKGPNAAGKSSVLDAIYYALAGKDVQPEYPVRVGTEEAMVTVDLGELVVTRKWKGAKGEKQTLEVKAKDGTTFSSPQKMLDALVGKLSFDPLEFANLGKTPEGRRQQEQILKSFITGVDFAASEAESKKAFERRTDVNREIKELEAQLKGTPVVNAPDEPVSMDALLAEQQLLFDSQRDQESTRSALKLRRAAHAEALSKVEERKKRVAELEAQLAKAREEVAQAEAAAPAIAAEVEKLETEAAGLKNLEPELERVRQAISEADAVNDSVRRRRARADLAAKVDAHRAESEGLTAKLEALAEERRKAIEAAKFPVPGLGFVDGGVTLDGLPLNQASMAQKVRLSIAVGVAKNPTVRVILVRDANVLDEETMPIVAEMAEKAGAQFWLERAGRRDAVGILIEDGEVVDGAPPAPETQIAPAYPPPPAAAADVPAAPAQPPAPAEDAGPVMEFGDKTTMRGRPIRGLSDAELGAHIKLGADWLADPKNARSKSRKSMERCTEALRTERDRRTAGNPGAT